jgi:ubiquinone biosynthesis protein UbiJ
MATKLTALRLTEEDKTHIRNIRESMELATDTDAVRMALKKLSERIEQVKAKRQEQLQEL